MDGERLYLAALWLLWSSLGSTYDDVLIGLEDWMELMGGCGMAYRPIGFTTTINSFGLANR